MVKLLMLKGLPASGKSTYARELVAKGWKRVNKDDLRAMIDDSKWSKSNEALIIANEQRLVIYFLARGHNVVVDDTNFAHEENWERLATESEAEFEVKFFDTPLTECILRDAKRGDKAVGVKVITGMYERYVKPKPVEINMEIGCTYIFDIDGTLAHANNRSPYDYSKVSTDTPDFAVTVLAAILRAVVVSSRSKIIIMSGRDSSCREATEKWLQDNEIEYHDLYMRPEGDTRKDCIVKQEIYEQNIKGKYNVLGIFDDRNQVVDMWRGLGLPCFQVGYGYF